MNKEHTITVNLNLPVNIDLVVEENDEGDDFEVKDAQLAMVQGIGVADVNENIDDDTFEEIMRKIHEAQG